MYKANTHYKGIRNFGSLYGTTVMFGGRVRNTFYEEQRFGINRSEKPSLIRRNVRTIKRMVLDSRPLESILPHNKLLGKVNQDDELNKTFDEQDIKPLQEQNNLIVVEEEKGHKTSQSFFLDMTINHKSCQVSLAVKYPSIMVFKCNDKQGMKLCKRHVLENLTQVPPSSKKVRQMASNYIFIEKEEITVMRKSAIMLRMQSNF